MSQFAKEDASVLISVVMWMGGILILVATFLLLDVKVVRTEKLFVHQRQAYWLARGEVRELVQSFNQEVPASSSWTEDFPFGKVRVDMTIQKTWDVKVVAQVEDAFDTLRFSYNPNLHQIVAWKDNGN